MQDDLQYITYEYDEQDTVEITPNQEQNQKIGHYAAIQSGGFQEFLLKPQLQRAIVDCGFEHPSEIQSECIPHAMIGVDILSQAKSGMGKTAVFVLTTLHQLPEKPKPISVLVLCHTRELAYQIKKEYDRFTKYLPDIKTEVIFGGIPLKDQIKMLKGKDVPQIVVGTPGRTLQLAKMKELDLSNVSMFVLDECDKMLEEIDMRSDVQRIFKFTPYQKQVMMFSATLAKDVRTVCRKFMKNQFEFFIDCESKLTLHGLKQYYVKLEERQKIQKLMQLLDSLTFNQVIIFTKTAQYAMKLDELLRKECFPSITMHRDLPQEERLKRYDQFKKFQYRIMVSTDLFGRGIDIEKVNVVVNFDMPADADSYLHRVGRAGRFGTKGLTVSFISKPEDLKCLELIQNRFEVKIEELPAVIDSSSYMNC